MPRLNYKHLHYFWHVAREGSVTAAAERLSVSQPSISAQIRKLEKSLGQTLFDRSGRSLSLTPEGKVVLDYADEIFRLGRELSETMEGRLLGRPMRLVVGLAHSIPKLVAFHLLAPALSMDDPVRLIVREERTERLLADLATHDLDLVIADMPVPPHASVRAFNHPLGTSTVDIFGPKTMVESMRAGFPASLHGAPFLVPSEGFALRRSLDEWFTREGVRPLTVAEMEDGALIKAFSDAGTGLFAAPSVIADEVCEKYDVGVVGRADGVVERFYAITGERRLRHPAAVAISEAARGSLFDA